MAEPIDEHFLAAVSALRPPSTANAAVLHGIPAQRCVDVFEAQLGSRHLDLAARWLRSKGKGFYTIGSSGHESNAAVAAVLRPTDPALLHYRSGGFYLARARQVAGSDPVRDVLLGLVAPSTSRSPADGTRCSAATTSMSSRRPPPSPRICAGARRRLLHCTGAQTRGREPLAG